MQLLKASSDGAVTAEAGREFQRRVVEGKKELLLSFTEQSWWYQESGLMASG